MRTYCISNPIVFLKVGFLALVRTESSAANEAP